MAQEIYHRSEWGNPTETWGNTYLNADLTNELYKRASEYENSWVTDQLLNGVGIKPSIILTPTAYEDGVLNSVKPSNPFGSELVINGSFETDSDWSKGSGWSIADGKAYYSGITNSDLAQSGILTSGKLYKLQYEVINSTLVNGVVKLSGTTASAQNVLSQTVGTHTLYFTADGTTPTSFNITIVLNISGQFELDNVSVKEVLHADFDFTRGSSATRVNELGLVQDVTDTDLPRINYTDGEGSLLLEPQSTNLITYSEDFSDGSWFKQSGGTGADPVITSNNTISPDGTQNADKVVFNKGTGTNTSNLSILSASFTSQSNTASFYVKADSQQRIVVRNSSTWVGYDIGTEWTRIEKTDTGGSLQIGLRDGYGVANVPNTATVYLWGAQVEALSYATSYIPTNGSTVTRLADVCNNSGNSDLINSTEGVLYAEISALANDGTFRMISISDGTNDNRVRINYTSTSNQIGARVNGGGVKQADFTHSLTDSNDFVKLAIYYKNNDCAFWVNGTKIGTDTSATMPSGLNTLNLNGGGGSPFYGNVKCVAVFKEALSDTELQKLTTI